MIKDTYDAIRAMFTRRTYAYRMVFDRNNKYTETVLKDLARFCRAYDSCFHKDERVHASLEGRREVWIRIEQYLNLNPEELLALHKVKDLTKGD